MDNRELLNYAYLTGKRLGRKFESTDVTRDGKLMQAARVYAESYSGDFEFMKTAKAKTLCEGWTTPGYAKAILNCLMADANKRMASKHSNPVEPSNTHNVSTVTDGRYRVVLPDASSLSVQLHTGHWPEEPESRAIRILIGANDWLTIGKATPAGNVTIWRKASDKQSRVMQALDILAHADDTLVYGLAYALEGSRCFICGLPLDTEPSIAAGYGKTCAENRGLPYGKLATPAKVLLARAGLTQTVEPVVKHKRTYDELFGEDAA